MSQSGTRRKLKRLGLIIITLTTIALGAVFLYPFLFPPPLSLAPEEEIKAVYRIPEGPFAIGDLIPVTLIVEARAGINYQMPDLPVGRLGPLEIRKEKQSTSKRRQGGIQHTVMYMLTPWETGELPLPPVTLYYQDREGAERIYELPPAVLVVHSLLPPGKTREELLALPLKGVKDPVGLPPDWTPFLWFLLILIGAFLLWLLVRFLQARFARPASRPEAQKPLEPADQIARRRLEALRQAAYLERGDYKGFYSELSALLREYIENRFEITALEMTTEEFLAYLAAPERLSTTPQAKPLFRPEHQCKLAAFLRTADLVKFARYIPATATVEADLAVVEQLITETREIPAPPAGTDGGGGASAILIDQEQCR